MKSSKPKVLILEDEPMSRINLTESLTRSGFFVTASASNSEEAITSLKNDPPDIAILDIQLEHSLLDGIQTARIIKEALQIPIIFLTALVDTTIVERAKEVNPAYYLIKPSSPVQLDVAIEMAIENFMEQKEAQVNHSLEGHLSKQEMVYPLKDILFIKKKGLYQRVNIHDLIWIEASNSSVIIETEDEKFVISANLKNFQKQFSHPMLLKIHRSYIVNVEKVLAFDDSSVQINKSGRRVSLPLGFSYKEAFDKIVFKLKSGG